MWMNRSLKYGVFIIPYGPLKLYWATRKVRTIKYNSYMK